MEGIRYFSEVAAIIESHYEIDKNNKIEMEEECIKSVSYTFPNNRRMMLMFYVYPPFPGAVVLLSVEDENIKNKALEEEKQNEDNAKRIIYKSKYTGGLN